MCCCLSLLLLGLLTANDNWWRASSRALTHADVRHTIAVLFCSCYGLFVVGSVEEQPGIATTEQNSESAESATPTEVKSEEFSAATSESHSFEDGSPDPPILLLVGTPDHVREQFRLH